MKNDELQHELDLGNGLRPEPVELTTAPVDLDPIMMDCGPDDLEIPAGWDLLPGGVKRAVAVNQLFLREQRGRPWQVMVGDKIVARATEFRTLGEAWSEAVETWEQRYDRGVYTTGPRMTARIVTAGPVLVRY